MPVDDNLLPDDLAERRETKGARSEMAAPRPVMVDAEAFADRLMGQRKINEDDGRPLRDVVRCKVRVQHHQHGVSSLRFDKSELGPGGDPSRAYVFGDTVYLKRAAFLARKGDGTLMRGD